MAYLKGILKWQKNRDFNRNDVMTSLKNNYVNCHTNINQELMDNSIELGGTKEGFNDIEIFLQRKFNFKYFKIIPELEIKAYLPLNSLGLSLKKNHFVQENSSLDGIELIGPIRDVTSILLDVENQIFEREFESQKLTVEINETQLDYVTSSKFIGHNYEKLCLDTFKLNNTNVRIKFIVGNITDQCTDAIVNSSNSRLTFTGQVSKEIQKKAGPTVTKFCEDYIGLHKTLKVSDVIVSSPGRLPCKFLIHTSSPNFSPFRCPGSSIKNYYNLLTETFLNCFNKVCELAAESISLPILCSGNAGLPDELIASGLYKALSKFGYQIVNNDQNHSIALKEIRIVNISKKKMINFINLFIEISLNKKHRLNISRDTEDNSLARKTFPSENRQPIVYNSLARKTFSPENHQPIVSNSLLKQSPSLGNKFPIYDRECGEIHSICDHISRDTEDNLLAWKTFSPENHQPIVSNSLARKTFSPKNCQPIVSNSLLKQSPSLGNKFPIYDRECGEIHSICDHISRDTEDNLLARKTFSPKNHQPIVSNSLLEQSPSLGNKFPIYDRECGEIHSICDHIIPNSCQRNNRNCFSCSRDTEDNSLAQKTFSPENHQPIVSNSLLKQSPSLGSKFPIYDRECGEIHSICDHIIPNSCQRNNRNCFSCSRDTEDNSLAQKTFSPENHQPIVSNSLLKQSPSLGSKFPIYDRECGEIHSICDHIIPNSCQRNNRNCFSCSRNSPTNNMIKPGITHYSAMSFNSSDVAKQTGDFDSKSSIDSLYNNLNCEPVDLSNTLEEKLKMKGVGSQHRSRSISTKGKSDSKAKLTLSKSKKSFNSFDVAKQTGDFDSKSSSDTLCNNLNCEPVDVSNTLEEKLKMKGVGSQHRSRSISTKGKSNSKAKLTLSKSKNDSSPDNDAVCPICLFKIMSRPKVLSCGHRFCPSCIKQWLSVDNKCPVCKKCFGLQRGNQPEGTMDVTEESTFLSGYEGYTTIKIVYYFKDGIQESDHPNPGQPYKGTKRTAYLPNNREGKQVLELLRLAFRYRLVFTIGRSNTTGRDNVVVWNDIHHKTSTSGIHGYPDNGYLSRVKDELKAKGVTLNLLLNEK